VRVEYVVRFGMGPDDRVFCRGVGFVYGAFQGYARALYAELLPPGEEARWYVLPMHAYSLSHLYRS
jgi:MFS-type transporter involved in bile tolerance (Atg22 family)